MKMSYFTCHYVCVPEGVRKTCVNVLYVVEVRFRNVTQVEEISIFLERKGH